ncbi:D-alanyl-D-alanine carboxypeptidase/D-alanyl-D-alanine-endopeptidase [soil metagenome]
MARRGQVGQAVAVILLTLAASAAGFVGIAPPQLVVGDPLPAEWSARYRVKPLPPKVVQAETATDKPPVVALGTVPAPVSVAPPEDPLVQSLALRLQQALLAAGDVGQSGVSVMDATGRVVFDAGGTTPLIPASTAKLVTAAAVLTAFGPDHTFTTTVAATTTPDGAGVIAGDLVLIGGGDPTLVSATYVEQRIDPDRPQTRIEGLADQLVASGVSAVEGGVIGDPGFLQGGVLADGWPQRYLDTLDATPIAGLTIDQGLAFTLEGGRLRARAADDPAAEAAAALTAALISRGVTVGQPSTVVEGARPGVAVELARVQSPPLMSLLTRMVQRSDNHLADTMFRAVGRRVEGVGSFTDGAEMVRRVLVDLQLDWTTTTLQDGSGLSRSSAIPPALLTTLNYRMTNSSVGAAWQDLMAVSGVSGTLSSRLTGSIAELRLRGKTGSLQDVRALTGAVVGPDGQPLYFTVSSNALDGPQVANARRLQDLVVLALAAELYTCTELPLPPDAPPTPPGELPPLPEHTCAR